MDICIKTAAKEEVTATRIP